MYRLNEVSQQHQATPGGQLIIQQHGHPSTQHILSGIPTGGGGNGGGGGSNPGQLNGNSVMGLAGSSSGGKSASGGGQDDVKMIAIKSEPMQDIMTIQAATTAASTSATTNGHMVFVPAKRSRLEGADDWLSSPSPGSVPSSAPPLSPSPGSQSHNFANMSNGYASPMSTGSYDPYSPNGKMGKLQNMDTIVPE